MRDHPLPRPRSAAPTLRLAPHAAAGLLALISLSSAPAADVSQPAADNPPFAQIERIVVGGAPTLQPSAGDVRLVRAQQLLPARPALPLFEDDELLTGAGVSLTILCLEEVAEERKTVIIGPGSQIRIRGRRSIFLLLGKLLANVRGLFDVATSRATLGSRGTEFEVRVTEDGGTQLLVLEGVVDLQRGEEVAAARRFDGPLGRLLQRGGAAADLGFRAPAADGRSAQRLPSPTAVSRLEEVTVQKGDAATTTRATSEDRVRGVLNWTSDAIMAGQPTYAAKRAIPHFDSAEERGRAFRQARFEALWQRAPGSYETLGKVYSDWDDGAKAFDAFTKERDPARRTTASFMANVGEALRMKGRLNEAEEQLTKAASVDPANARALNGLGNVYFAQAAVAEDAGALDAARALLEKCLGIYASTRQARLETPRTPNGVAWANDGEAKVALGDIAQQQNRLEEAAARYGEAKEAFTRAAKVDTRYPFATVGLADSARRMGDVAGVRGAADQARQAYRDAEAEYRKALDAHPDLSAAHTGLGDVFIQTGRREAALESYTRAAMIRPDQPTPFLRLAVALSDENPRAAAVLARTYLELEKGRSIAVSPDGKLTQGKRAALATRIVEGGGAGAGGRGAGVDRGGGKVIPPATAVRIVPKVEELARAEAIRIIQREGFTVGRIEARESGKPADTVLDQKPNARSNARAGSAIDLVVAIPKAVKVPDVVGDSRDRAERELRGDRLVLGTITERASCEEAGKVLAQEPPEDARVVPGTAVSLVVAGAGPRPASVPRLTGLQLRDAERVLSDQQLKVGKIGRRESDRWSSETIIDQKPEPSTRIAPGCRVDLVIAVPVPKVQVPNFIGMTVDQARQQLTRIVPGPGGLTLGSIQSRQARGTPGTVIGQDPPPGALVDVGTRVNLVVVAEREAPPDDRVLVPNVIGRMGRDAEAVLRRAGLRADLRTYQARATAAPPKPGSVMSQTPEPNARVPRGSVVVLLVAPEQKPGGVIK